MSNLKNKPSVFDYSDYRLFLSDMFDWEKSRGFYSHRVFAEKAGLKSRSYLRLIVVGKRNLTPDSIIKFASALGLSSFEADAFTALVHFNQAGNHAARKHYWEVFSKFKPKDYKPQKVHDLYAYLTKVLYPVLLVILRQSHVAQDVNSLAKVTGLSADQIKEAINTFSNMGVLLTMPDGSYRVTAPAFETGNDILNVAVPIFHQNMLKLAQEATELPQSEREFQSIMMPLDEKEFNYLKKRLRDLADEFDQMFGTGSRPHSNRAYVLNMNLIPATKDFIRTSESVSTSQNQVQIPDLKEVFL